MASRPIWRGHLRLALVSCPVALFNSRHDRSAIRFNMINPETGNRIKMVTQDSETNEPLERRDLVKGYEYKKNSYVIISDEDLDSVKVESSAMMAVEKFIDTDSIDPMYFDASYYLAPDGKSSEDVYAVLREAIKQTGKTALTRVVISQRERTVALRPMGAGLMAHTLYEERDINSPAELFEDAAKLKTDPEMVKLATMLIERQSGRYDPADLEDRYETRLRAMLDAKIKGEELRDNGVAPMRTDNVIDLMEALRKSIGEPIPKPPAAQTASEPKGRKKVASPEEARRQPGFKLPIEGGRKAAAPAGKKATEPPVVEPAAKPRRKVS